MHSLQPHTSAQIPIRPEVHRVLLLFLVYLACLNRDRIVLRNLCTRFFCRVNFPRVKSLTKLDSILDDTLAKYGLAERGQN